MPFAFTFKHSKINQPRERNTPVKQSKANKRESSVWSGGPSTALPYPPDNTQQRTVPPVACGDERVRVDVTIWWRSVAAAFIVEGGLLTDHLVLPHFAFPPRRIALSSSNQSAIAYRGRRSMSARVQLTRHPQSAVGPVQSNTGGAAAAQDQTVRCFRLAPTLLLQLLAFCMCTWMHISHIAITLLPAEHGVAAACCDAACLDRTRFAEAV